MKYGEGCRIGRSHTSINTTSEFNAIQVIILNIFRAQLPSYDFKKHENLISLKTYELKLLLRRFFKLSNLNALFQSQLANRTEIYYYTYSI